ncbi:methylenetetrahydrofolate reductase C-terminal domain-containing protein [Desulfobacula sp.]|uniref:methylenetetrahydrofolate reductase C-terminal domain-containing protein n=1 Tax=Desulfobacula sp. TaxID=2593537 RepID=UPI00260DC417|nr:methylenetetrahydrofolate reductase C-terminal domain-containing protein [Desulfobacula sp.]
MLRIFNDEILNPKNFVVTLELVPGRESFGRTTDTLIGIAKDAFADGRVSAVSITDNPGGNPSLSPDVLGYEIFKHGLDVIVHFTCRDMNRVGMESRALQLARMGMKNILALTGDYSGSGFGGRGAPVFDLDSVLLNAMFKTLSQKLLAWGDPEEFLTGCAVSPFKTTEAECHAQYKKMDKKIEAGASFVVTQLGYNVKKFHELIRHHTANNPKIPVMASVFLLSPRSARAMNRGRVPGAHVSDDLFNRVVLEWKKPRPGLNAAIERAAKLGVILKGLGYRGIHIGGIHRSFKTVGAILDRMEEIEDHWQAYLDEFEGTTPNTGYYVGKQAAFDEKRPVVERMKETMADHIPYRLLKAAHGIFFDKEAMFAPVYKHIARFLETHKKGWILKRGLEDPIKIIFLSCQSCGDCGIAHAAFQCPESGCPKHTRNGPCGGSRNGYCEVYPEKRCIWVRAYDRLKHAHESDTFLKAFVPPRMWELNKTSAWINYHLGKDHQK